MNVLQNLSIKTRLGIGYLVITGALILVAIMGLHGEAQTQESLDNQVNHLNVVKSLGNQVLDAAKAAYEVATLEIAVLNLVMTNIRTAIGSMDLDESLSKRDEINTKVLVAVDQATHPWGIKVNRIELKDIQPPRDLVESMARQMKAEREKRANILEAEGFRQAAILKAEGEKQSVILEAEGGREAAFREAEARERLAEAEAKATQMVSDAIASGNVQAINYFVAQKYIEAFKALAEAPNQKFVMMPMESAGVIGSLGGIAELAKEAMERQPSGRAVASSSPGA